VPPLSDSRTFFYILTTRCITGADITGGGGDAGCVGTAPGATAALRTFERLLLTLGEHTWGWNGGHTRRNSWSNPELTESLKNHSDEFYTSIGTWLEQRAFYDNAVAALPQGSPLAMAINAGRKDIDGYGGAPFDATNFKDTPASDVQCNDLVLSVESDGTLTGIRQSNGTGGHVGSKFFKVSLSLRGYSPITVCGRILRTASTLPSLDLTSHDFAR
jgi:hypothetical protein